MSNNIKYSWIFLNYNLYEVKIYYSNKIIILRCSHKLIPFSIDHFFPTFSNNKKLYFPYEILTSWNPNILCSQFNLIEYQYKNLTINEYMKCYIKQNVLILNEGLNNFFFYLKKINIPFSKKNLSCSSISFNFYLKFFNKINFNLKNNIKSIAEQAYFGGKCEVYGNSRLNEKILHFDFSSMYFHCMQEELPFDEFYFKDTNLNLNEPGFYYINIEYYHKFPVLPIKSDKLYFKEGVISGWFWYEEIQLVLKYIKPINFELIHGLISTKNEKILFEFLNTLNQFKDNNSIKKKLGKLLINSFYGRLALRDDMFSIELVNELKHHKSYGMLNDFFIIKKKIQKSTKNNIAIAAAIASKARIKLYEAQQEVLNHNGHLLYSDTDSIFASFNKNNNIENKLLGKYVYFDTNKYDTVIKEAVFMSSKSYAIKLFDETEIIKIKGINIKNVGFDEISYKFYNNIDGITLQNNQISKKNLTLHHYLTSKNINIQNYNKRTWINNKTDTKPIINV